MLVKVGNTYIETLAIESIERVGDDTIRVWTKSGKSTLIDNVPEADFDALVKSAIRHAPISREDLVAFQNILADAIVESGRKAGESLGQHFPAKLAVELREK